MKEHGIEPSPDRTSDSWADFLNRHGETLRGCDLFSVKSVTAKGICDLYVLVFLCLKTREVFVTESTTHPDSAWVCEMTEWFAEQTKDREKKPEMLIHDRDVKFTKDFTKTVKDAGMKTNPLPMGSPNLNGRCERVIETIKLECLAKFIIFGKGHLDYLITESLALGVIGNYHLISMDDTLPLTSLLGDWYDTWDLKASVSFYIQ